MGKELKPCPFCGNEDLDHKIVTEGGNSLEYIYCRNCGTCGPAVVLAPEPAWNARVSLSRPHKFK